MITLREYSFNYNYMKKCINCKCQYGQDTYLSAWPALSVFSALIRVRAAAASSRAQLTDDVSRRSTSGSAKALPSAVDSLPMPAKHQKGTGA